MTKVTQLNTIRNSLQLAFDKKTLVEIVTNGDTGPGEFTGFVIKLSNQFFMLHVIEDWHADGVQIFPIGRISSVNICDNNVEREKILQWRNLEDALSYYDINIESFFTIFFSLQRKNSLVLIEDFESTEVGRILNFTDQSLTLKGIDGAGRWLDEEIVRPYSDIWYVIYNDEYSRVLDKYLKSRCQ
jgi:hypothetical protein